MLLFSVLYGFWAANFVAFKGHALRELSAQFLALAKKQKATGPLVIAHRLLATALLHTGDIADARAHYDQAIGLYDPAEHRPLAIRFGQDVRMTILSFRSLALWCLGYPEAALLDADYAVKDVREINQAASLMYALFRTSFAHVLCGNYATAKALSDELVALADEKGALFWKAQAYEPPRLLFGLDWRRRRRRSHDHIRAVGLPLNRSNRFRALAPVNSGEGLCETRTSSTMLGAASAKR